MSVPVPVMFSPLDTFVVYLNSSPYFIGLMMLILNLGGRFLALEVTKEQEKIFQHPWFRRFLIFTVFFMGTRNVFVALIMTIIAILCMGYLFNENSSLCLFNSGAPGSTCDAPKENGLTIEEQEIFRRLNEKQMKLAVQNKVEVKKEEMKPSDIYWNNISAMNPRF